MNYGQTCVYGVSLSYLMADGERSFHTTRFLPKASMKQSNMCAANGTGSIYLLLMSQM